MTGRNRKRRFFAAPVILVLLSVSPWAQSKRPDLLVPLKFLPQESVRTGSVALPGSVIDRSVEIRVEDSRRQADARLVGEGTDDDDRVFPIKASTDVVPFVSDAISQMASAWRLTTSPPAAGTRC